MRVSQVPPQQTGKKNISLCTWLHAQAHWHVETGKELPKTVAMKFKALYCLSFSIGIYFKQSSQIMTAPDQKHTKVYEQGCPQTFSHIVNIKYIDKLRLLNVTL